MLVVFLLATHVLIQSQIKCTKFISNQTSGSERFWNIKCFDLFIKDIQLSINAFAIWFLLRILFEAVSVFWKITVLFISVSDTEAMSCVHFHFYHHQARSDLEDIHQALLVVFGFKVLSFAFRFRLV